MSSFLNTLCFEKNTMSYREKLNFISPGKFRTIFESLRREIKADI